MGVGRRSEVSPRIEHLSWWTPHHTPIRYDELAERLPAWERKVREVEKFDQSANSADLKMWFLRQLANDDFEKFPSHLSATGGHGYETLRVYAEAWIAQKRTPGADKNKSTQEPSRRRVTHSLGELGRQDVRSDVRETREEDFVP